MDITRETVTVTNRADFAQWAVERARAIVAGEGGDLALAARGADDNQIAATGNALGQAIVDALLDVFDSLLTEYPACPGDAGI
ncbi:hypothetical protein ABID21_004937 [Pseudorhizobium tarimense]|uniref:Uncharacterized protein n=1 Tax=Pseudorhizobium tarimense TaxID=1079109 RepID=A0ABV2HEG9_9HYPH|nr:hypothetical protein [Pseudorhizobium tarimense]